MKTPLLVATDGTAGSLGALHVARALADREGRPVVVLSVLESLALPPVGASYPLVASAPEVDAAHTERLRDVVAAQLLELGGTPDGWRIEVELGTPAITIVRRAVELEADRIVMGLGRHDATDRWLGTETALKVVHLAHVPVLAVQPDARALPNRALVAIDFSDFARDAARAVADLVGPNGEIHLAHVAWKAPDGAATEAEADWLETYRVGAIARLEELRRELQTHHRTRIVTTLLGGEISRALIKYARMTAVDLIATGSHGYGFFGRMMLGSSSTRVLRQARCSVLIAPPRALVVEVLQAREPERIEVAPQAVPV